MRTHKKHLLICAFLTLAACSFDAPPTSKLPHVRMETATHTVAFHGGSQLSHADAESLADFAYSVSPSATHDVTIAVGDGPSSQSRANAVGNFLVAQGYDRHLIHVVISHDMSGNEAVVALQYAKALPPQGCPDWSKNSVYNYENTDASNFGCAYNNNFIIQLADPEDYNGAHSKPTAEGPRDSVAIGKYLSDTPQSAGGGSSGGSSGGSTTTTTSSP